MAVRSLVMATLDGGRHPSESRTYSAYGRGHDDRVRRRRQHRSHRPPDMVGRPRHQGRRHRSPARGRRRAEGRQRPPRHGDEPRAARLPALPAGHAPRPDRPAVGRPRPVRPVQRALVADPVLPAVPVRATASSCRDLESLRTWDSLTPGHPEYHHTAGVEVTTGPLGQGVANAVGMAMAARRERGLFDPDAAPGESPFDHFVYVIAGDGCMEEGVASEASSLAGHQQLGNLILFYDDNHISIEDDTAVAFSEDVLKRYEAYGWHTQHVDSGEDVAALREGDRRGQGGHRQAVDHRRHDDHRLARADAAEHRQGARLGARRRRDQEDQGDPRLRPGRRLRRPGRRARAHPRRSIDRGRDDARRVAAAASTRWAAGNPDASGAATSG